MAAFKTTPDAPDFLPRSRVKELRHVRAGDLKENPKNWRKHPQFQVEALRGALARVGYADAVIAREVDGQLILLDGHLRAATTPNAMVPVLVVDLDDDEADFLLATLDPIAAMAKTDGEMLKTLTEAINAENVALQHLFNKTLKQAGIELHPGTSPGPVYSDDRIIDAAFEWFRQTGFPYRNVPIHVSMQRINQLALSETSQLANSIVAYEVADTYHPHRYHGKVGKAQSLVDAFQEDKYLRKACQLTLDYGGVIPAGYFGKLAMVSSTQVLSNFRPGFASMLYRGHCAPDATVLDTCTGYGGRLVGFMAACPRGRYIGIDPNTLTHAGNLRMAQELGFAGQVELHCEAAEDVAPDLLQGRCDFAFTSPPYFSKEHYSDEATQSWVRYPDADKWRTGFLEPLLRLQFAALKPGKYAVLNVQDVEIDAQKIPLVEWTLQAARTAGFEYVRTEEFQLHERFGAGQMQIGSELILVFQKPEGPKSLNGNKQ